MMVHAVLGHHLAGLGQLAVATLSGGHVDDDAAGLHRAAPSRPVISFGAGLPGMSAVVMMMSTSLRLLREHLALRLLEAFAHHLGIAADAAAFLDVIDRHVLAAERADLVADFRPRVVGAHDRAEARGRADGGSPATPAPITKTFAGGTLPAAVI
jgi:hypothetical protein